MPPQLMAAQSSLQFHSPDQSTTWRGISGAVVRDAPVTCRVELSSATHWPPLFPQAHRRSCAAEGPAQRGHLLTGVGARQQAVGNARVATPRSVSRMDTAGVLREGADPRTALEKQVSETLLLPACALVAPGLLSVSCSLSFLRGRVFCCAGVVLFSLGFLPWAPTQKPSTLESNLQVRTRLRSTWLLALVETLGCLLYCAQHNSSHLSRLRPFSLPRIGLSTGLLGNGNDTTACGHPFSQFLRHGGFADAWIPQNFLATPAHGPGVPT